MYSSNKSNNEIGSKDDDDDQGMDDSGNQEDNGSSLRKAIGILFVCFVWVFTVAFAIVIIAA